ncbi:MAG TPA: prepilin-type N-terminal cleavage/methylation domain-containing protein [Bryobacteraceae bacterium]|nr:prepilin-type N-terminal cleavage/methylation domain-containing protein [Bryobacteraceae bacterium]
MKRCEEAARAMRPAGARGVTLIEMLVVVAIIALLAGITFPSVASGVETMRLNQASNDLVTFFNDALARAGRRELAVEITISKTARTLSMASPGARGETRIEMPQGISIVHVLPEPEQETDAPRRFMVYPGGTPPGVGVEISNSRNVHRIVRVDPITGVPRIEKLEGAR